MREAVTWRLSKRFPDVTDGNGEREGWKAETRDCGRLLTEFKHASFKKGNEGRAERFFGKVI